VEEGLVKWIPGYYKVYRLRKWIEQTTGGVLKGYFGGGKTLANTQAITDLKRSGGGITYAIASPLRKLRDYIYDKWLRGAGFKMLAHDEVCPALRKRIEEDPAKPYLLHLAEHLKNDTCYWGQYLDDVKDAVRNNEIIVSTHVEGILVKLLSFALKVRSKVFFDESEDFLIRLKEGIYFQELEALKNSNYKLYLKIRRYYKRDVNKYFVHESLLQQFFRSYLISATMPPVLEEYIEWRWWGGWLPKYHLLTEESRDVVILYDMVLEWDKYDKWRRKMYPVVLDIVAKSVDRHGVAGIVSRNYEMTRDLHKLLEQAGYKVSSDWRQNLEGEADVYIITTMGKWYRGISILPKKSPQGDFPVIIAFFQGKVDQSSHPFLLDELSLFFNKEHQYRRELMYGKNLQALYRFNRIRRNRHVMILLDHRWKLAYRVFYYRKWAREFQRFEVDDLAKLYEMARNVL